MENRIFPEEETDKGYRKRFLPFLRLFAEIGAQEKLFPKECRTCGKKFRSFSHYLCATTPKGHSLEDCSDVMGKPFTMIYRHCSCGNTLVLSLTEETFSDLESFWSMLNEEAEVSNRTLRQVVAEFAELCVDYVLEHENPCFAADPDEDR